MLSTGSIVEIDHMRSANGSTSDWGWVWEDAEGRECIFNGSLSSPVRAHAFAMMVLAPLMLDAIDTLVHAKTWEEFGPAMRQLRDIYAHVTATLQDLEKGD